MKKTILIAIALTLLASPAAAQDRDDDGYAYVFEDDPLSGLNHGSTAAQIRVRPQGVRQMLLRPRVHFIPELLKSVEQI